MQVTEYRIPFGTHLDLPHCQTVIRDFFRNREDVVPIRFFFENFTTLCVTVIEDCLPKFSLPILAQDHFRPILTDPKNVVHNNDFNVALVIPTGLGASFGGHAGDAGPVSQLIASLCDRLITHPNVVNASDLNEMTTNTLYTEGYLLSQFLLGRAGLKEVRNNRVLVVIDGNAERVYVDAAINSVNAAVSTYGLTCPEVVVLEDCYNMFSKMSKNKRATGWVTNLDPLFKVLEDKKGTYDAVALTSLINLQGEIRDRYYNHGGVNPWGGIEAMLTHAVSHCFKVPCAHAPMMESQEVEMQDYGVIDPRDAAEIVSLTYIQSVLKGLHRAPRFCEPFGQNIDCLIVPRKCFGIPVMAAKERGIPVIVVENELEVESIDCRGYTDDILVKNYLEAAGVVAARRSGVNVKSLRRPLLPVLVGSRKEKLCHI